MADLSSWETLYLWHLIGRKGSASWKDRPVQSIEAKHRRGLETRGLVEVNRGTRGTLIAEVTDAGWAWAAEHMDSPLPSSKGATAVLQDWLSVISGYIRTNRLGLGDLFAGEAGIAHEPGQTTGELLQDDLRAAYLARTGGRWGTEVRVADLKSAFPTDRHPRIDEALMALARLGKADLLPIDDPLRLTVADRAAAIHVAGQPRHLVFLHPDE